MEDEPAILRGIATIITNISDEFLIEKAYDGIEALSKIRIFNPEIVITDIQMPVIDGLNLIEQAKEMIPKAFFIILTGYSEFDYAKRALDLRVMEYLLKPVDPDALECLIGKLSKEIVRDRRNVQLEYIRQNVYKNMEEIVKENPLGQWHLHLLFAFYGPITTNIYNELTQGQQAAIDMNYRFLKEISEKSNLRVYVFPGNYLNEQIFAILTKCEMEEEKKLVLQTAQFTFRHLITERIFLNCILSEGMTDSKGIQKNVQACYLFAGANIVYGQSKLYYCNSDFISNEPICVNDLIKEYAVRLHPNMKQEGVAEVCKVCIGVWETEQAMQGQIQTDIRYIISSAVQKNPGYTGGYPDAAEIVASSSSFGELYDNILMELEKLFAISNHRMQKGNNTKNLVFRVRDYLDKNFTKTITYKDFNNVFGYNEKYISMIFKEELGVSPSKYIIQLRLSMAKNLMKENPDALLKDVAEAVGYDDPFYFSRVFKNSEGISPKVFQKNIVEEGKY